MTTVSFPARCAVAVVYGPHLVSQVYPAAVPIEVFLDNVIELLNDELSHRGLDTLDPAVGYELQRANGIRLDVTRTLDELGVEDGATLVLMPRVDGDAFTPQYESLSTGLARIGKRMFEPVTARTAVHLAMAVVAMGAATLLGLACWHRLASDSPAPSVILGVVGLLTTAAAVATHRWRPDGTDLLDGFAWVSAPLLAAALAGAAPGELGSAHLFIAALAAMVIVYGISVATGRFITVAAALMTLCGLSAILAAVRMWVAAPVRLLGMATLVLLLLLLTLAPTIALWCARIRPPHFGSITGRDLFRRSDGSPADTVEPVPDAPDGDDPDDHRDVTARGARIAAAALHANRVLTGVCVGAGMALPVAVWATLAPGRDHGTAAAVLAGLFVVIFGCRSRAFSDKRQAVALWGGAAASVCLGVISYVAARPADAIAPLVWAAGTLAAFAGVALVAGLLVPVTTFTPLVRMAVEWVELVAIVAALPLAAAIGGLFTWVRMR